MVNVMKRSILRRILISLLFWGILMVPSGTLFADPILIGSGTVTFNAHGQMAYDDDGDGYYLDVSKTITIPTNINLAVINWNCSMELWGGYEDELVYDAPYFYIREKSTGKKIYSKTLDKSQDVLHTWKGSGTFNARPGDTYIFVPWGGFINGGNDGSYGVTHGTTKGSFTYYYYQVNDEAPPNVPQNLKITSTKYFSLNNNTTYTNSNVTLGWDSAADNGTTFNGFTNTSGIQQYNIYDNSSSQGTITYQTVSPVTTYTFTDLASGSHAMQVRAQDNANNYSSYGDRLIFTVDVAAPGTPDIPTASNERINGNIKGSAVDWGWNNVTDNDSGLKQYHIHISCSDGTIIDDVTSGNSYTQENAKDGRSYTCKVWAEDNVGNIGPASLESGKVTIDSSVPPATLPVYPVHLNDSRATFNWNPIIDPGAGIGHYEVALTHSASNPDYVTPMELHTTENTQYSFAINSSATPYYAWVRGVDSLGNKGIWIGSDSFPQYTISGPEDGGYVKSGFTVEVSTVQADHLNYRLVYQRP